MNKNKMYYFLNRSHYKMMASLLNTAHSILYLYSNSICHEKEHAGVTGEIGLIW